MKIADPQPLKHFPALLFQTPGPFLIHALTEHSQFRQQSFIIWIGGNGIAQGTEANQQITFGSTTFQHLFEHRQAWSHRALLPDQGDVQSR